MYSLLIILILFHEKIGPIGSCEGCPDFVHTPVRKSLFIPRIISIIILIGVISMLFVGKLRTFSKDFSM